MNEELKPAPCPHCGVDLVGEGDSESNFYAHAKNDCLLSEWEFPDLDIAAWNRRTPVSGGRGDPMHEFAMLAIGTVFLRGSEKEAKELAEIYRQARGQQTGAAAALIAKIVDRDTPPDNRNEVIDHDIRGNPITRSMTDSLVKRGAQ